METGIYIYATPMQRSKTVLVVPTSRALHIVMITHKGLVERTVGSDEERFMRPAMTLKQGLPKFGGIARRKGSTKAARKWMAKAREAIA